MKAKTRSQLEKAIAKLMRGPTGERVRESIRLKSKIVDEIKTLLRQYRVLAIAAIDGVPSSESKRLYSKLAEYGIVVKLYKNTLMLRALREVGSAGLDDLAKYLTGANVFLFTNMNPFELAKVLENVVEYRYAKPGDQVGFDVELTPGPTDIKPGPSMSLFGKLKIPTQVREGVIWIAKDVKVLKQGEKVSPELCSLLRKLGVRIIPVKINLKAVYERGYLFKPEQLRLDYEEVKKELITAVSLSKALALELALPIPELIPELIAKAQRISIELAAATGFVTAETASILVMRALSQAYALAQVIAGKAGLSTSISAGTTQTPKKEEGGKEPEERREEKEPSEEEITEGIATLFG